MAFWPVVGALGEKRGRRYRSAPALHGVGRRTGAGQRNGQRFYAGPTGRGLVVGRFTQASSLGFNIAGFQPALINAWAEANGYHHSSLGDKETRLCGIVGRGVRAGLVPSRARP